MNSILMKDMVQEKDRISYIKTQIERILCLPPNYKLRQDVIFWAGKLPLEIKNNYFEKIKEWFDG